MSVARVYSRSDFMRGGPRAARRICWRARTSTRRLSRSCPSYPRAGRRARGACSGGTSARRRRTRGCGGAAADACPFVGCVSFLFASGAAMACLWLYVGLELAPAGPCARWSSRPCGFSATPDSVRRASPAFSRSIRPRTGGLVPDGPGGLLPAGPAPQPARPSRAYLSAGLRRGCLKTKQQAARSASTWSARRRKATDSRNTPAATRAKAGHPPPVPRAVDYDPPVDVGDHHQDAEAAAGRRLRGGQGRHQCDLRAHRERRASDPGQGRSFRPAIGHRVTARATRHIVRVFCGERCPISDRNVSRRKEGRVHDGGRVPTVGASRRPKW